MDYYTQQFNPSQESELSHTQPSFQNQNQNQKQTKTQNPPSKNPSIFESLSIFFNYKTGSILALATAMCIGGAFKDLIQNLTKNIMQPLIIKLLIITKMYNISIVSSAVNEENSVMNIASASSAIISFLITIITVYFLFTLIFSKV